ncbi:maleylpyruvate isomerase family mycothiol-dependent enzyme [Streptomyces ficellus]|uniref:Maleylpyruvate isomerase family mycothiol-dependent enzyme n=1 Tax=Streptomyces ficellus TaxID=1977088 RepID=A0A6I6FXW2_9ACTN|nr:maleylpyruvate isomerase family mycothiol-dependent enzyme [Streptomyces ficellus]QGV82916.1 maleylpyruvate isomerase family mycothiol-dependent enzyme [Streptomyces ficellus]
MEITEHIKYLAAEGQLLAGTAERAGTGAAVATCPKWRVRDLLRHTGMVHRWATAFVTEGHPSYHPAEGEPDLDGAELLGWFREGHGRLVSALTEAPDSLACWAFLPAPSPRAFWARRQAHETAVHRADAQSALGAVVPDMAPEFAADGIDELLCGMHSREKSRVRTPKAAVLRVRATDTADVWTVHLSDRAPRTVRTDGGDADCELSGTAAELYLALWNRLPLEAVTVSGDEGVALLWRETSAVTWS